MQLAELHAGAKPGQRKSLFLGICAAVSPLPAVVLLLTRKIDFTSLLIAGISLGTGIVVAIMLWASGKNNQAAETPILVAAEPIPPPPSGPSMEQLDLLSKLVRRLEGLASGAADGFPVLVEALGNLSTSGNQIKSSQITMHEVLGDYTHEVQSEIKSVTSIGNTIRGLGQASGRHRVDIEKLRSTSGEAEIRLSMVHESICRISDSIKNMNNFLEMIEDVNARISILAINAAIEAAHVGVAGRGFAVIATQIRSLSDETAKSSHIIGENVSKMIGMVSETNTATDSALNFVKNVLGQSSNTAAGLHEIIGSLDELGKEISALMESVERVSADSTRTEESVESTDKAITANMADLGTLHAITGTITVDIDSMLREIKALVGMVAELKKR